MILSNDFKFIYLKNARVASTSTEIALSQFCTNGNDIVTMLQPKWEKFRRQFSFTTPPRNFHYPGISEDEKDWSTAKRTPDKKFWSHMGASDVLERISLKTWNKYYKFAVERNPWDRAVSIYYHASGRQRTDEGVRSEIEDFLLSGKRGLSNWGTYTIDDEIVVDRVVLYENLEEELNEIGELLGFPDKVPINKVNARTKRRKNHSNYRNLYTKRARQIIEKECAKEIEAFGYEF